MLFLYNITMEQRWYICIDLKSFYASVECVERGLDPLTTNLVVADESRTNKTICLAVSPSLKTYGLPGRCRLFEVEQKMDDINYKRERKVRKFTGKSYDVNELKNDFLKVDYIVAAPRMKFYMNYSTEIYGIYLKYIAKEDIHVYSIDEVFIDVTPYLNIYQKTPKEIAMMLIREVLTQTGITATAGVGTNMFLAKIAMDIVAKKMPADKDGVRIAELDERSYREKLWDHQPLTDFWRVGKGTQTRLEKYGIYTMGDIALMSEKNEELLYKEFGINAELLIDHAWGYEPARMIDIKSYTPMNNSLSNGQVLSRAYSYQETEIVIKEMATNLALDLVSKGLVTNLVGLYVGYDFSSMEGYLGDTVDDFYGRIVPKPAHGSYNLKKYTNLESEIREALLNIYHQKVNGLLTIRRLAVSANVLKEEIGEKIEVNEQLDLFNEVKEINKEKKTKEKNIQKTIVEIQKKYGKNAVVKALDLEKCATTIERNGQVGGHKG